MSVKRNAIKVESIHLTFISLWYGMVQFGSVVAVETKNEHHHRREESHM